MRRRARVDDNQPKIVEALKRIKAGVIHTHTLKGAFDILVSFRGQLYPIEIKDGEKLPKKFWSMNEEQQKEYLETLLTDDEKDCKRLIEATGNKYHIVYDVESTLRTIGAFETIKTL